MSDVTLLGVIAAGLGFYCLHLQWKYRSFLIMFQITLAGIYKGGVTIEKAGDVYYPVPKKQQT